MKTYEVRLMRNGEEIENLNLDAPGEIAEHFGVPAGAIKQVCEWADELQTAQGYATDDVTSIVIEPADDL